MTNTTKLPVWFWVIAVAALLWNLMGVSAYISDAYGLVELSEAEQNFNLNKPIWFTAAYAVAVFAGFIGSVALLLRKKWAVPAFLLSLIAVLVQQIYSFFIQKDMPLEGFYLYITLAVIIIAGLLYWYSKGAREKAWLL